MDSLPQPDALWSRLNDEERLRYRGHFDDYRRIDAGLKENVRRALAATAGVRADCYETVRRVEAICAGIVVCNDGIAIAVDYLALFPPEEPDTRPVPDNVRRFAKNDP